jgi:hypothetical protein
MSDSVKPPSVTAPCLKSPGPILSPVCFSLQDLLQLFLYCIDACRLATRLLSQIRVLAFKSTQKLPLPPPPPGAEIETLIELCEEFETPEECSVCIYWARITTFLFHHSKVQNSKTFTFPKIEDLQQVETEEY